MQVIDPRQIVVTQVGRNGATVANGKRTSLIQWSELNQTYPKLTGVARAMARNVKDVDVLLKDRTVLVRYVSGETVPGWESFGLAVDTSQQLVRRVEDCVDRLRARGFEVRVG